LVWLGTEHQSSRLVREFDCTCVFLRHVLWGGHSQSCSITVVIRRRKYALYASRLIISFRTIRNAWWARNQEISSLTRSPKSIPAKYPECCTSTTWRVNAILSTLTTAGRASMNANSDSARANNPHMSFFTSSCRIYFGQPSAGFFTAVEPHMVVGSHPPFMNASK